jgi:hypothetical protein
MPTVQNFTLHANKRDGVWSINYCRFWTPHGAHLQKSSSILKTGPCPETLVTNHQPATWNSGEERRPQSEDDKAAETWNLAFCILRIYMLEPTGYVTHHHFNIQQLYALPTLYLRVLHLSENTQRLVPLIGFYNRDEKCLLRDTNWIFK